MRGLLSMTGGIAAAFAEFGAATRAPELNVTPRGYALPGRRFRVARAAPDPDPLTRQVARRKARIAAKGRRAEDHVPATPASGRARQ
uniref:hypothetical protein n=1 Tax=Ruegeria arenilitoris TaxID=1173585 RepID=UPI00147ECD43|nr:hypothetical protein [Ruegeria arenilitoris]